MAVSLLDEARLRLRDLIAPRDCAGCGRLDVEPLCHPCMELLDGLVPVAVGIAGRRTVECVAAGEYEGVLRNCLLNFKERRRRELAKPLARLLARAAGGAGTTGGGVVFVPIPATRASIRRRGFDQVALLCRYLPRLVPDSVMARVLRAGPRPDSTGLSRAERCAAAVASLRIRPATVRVLRRLARREVAMRIFLVDDITTSGATLAAAVAALAAVGVPVTGAMAVAATSRRSPRK